MVTRLFFTMIVAFFINIIPSFGQETSYFFKDDFIYNGQPYRLSVEKKSLFIFRLTSFSEKMDTAKFDLVNLENVAVFENKLSTTLTSLSIDKHVFKGSVLEQELFKLLNPIKDSIDHNVSINLEKSQSNIVELLTQIGKTFNCDTLQQIDLIDTLSKNALLKSFFETQRLSCENYQKLQKNQSQQQNKQLAFRLFERIKTSYKIKPENASLAGQFEAHDTINAFFFLEDYPINVNTSKNDSSESYKEQYKYDSIYVMLTKSLSNNNEFREHKESECTSVATISDKRKKRSKRWEQIKGLYKNTLDSTGFYSDFILDSLQIEFENGTINNIKAIGQLNGQTEIFQNLFPIPYSTKVALNDGEYIFFLKSTLTHPKIYIRYSELFYNNYNLLLRTENYAPKDQIVTFFPNRPTMIYKEKNKEILQTKIFTDFVGLGGEEPNGILQVEFSKKVNLSTEVLGKPTKTDYRYWFNYIEPKFLFSKIEDNDRNLQINKIPTLDSVKYATYGDILKYRRASFSTDLNIHTFGFPKIHSKLDINYGINFSLISFKDEINKTDTITNSNIITKETNIEETITTHLSLNHGPRIKYWINPSDKYQFSISYSLEWFKFFNTEENPILPIANLNTLKSLSSNYLEKQEALEWQVFHTFEFLAAAYLKDDGQLFFRTRYNFLHKNNKQNFFQIQLGYSFYFFSRNGN